MTGDRWRALTTAALVALGGCAELDYQRCGGTVCPVGTACCGDACVAATCGDGVRDEGEACDQTTGASCYQASAALGDFGQLGCTGGCELDATPCGRFGFVPAGGSPCPITEPIALTARGDSAWIATVDGVTRIADGACTPIAHPSTFTRMVSLPGAVVVAANRVDPSGDTIGELGVIVDDRWQALATGSTNPVRGVIAVDDDTAIVRRSNRLLTVVSRAAGGWMTRDVLVGCAAATGISNVGRRIDAIAAVDGHLLFALHEPPVATRDTRLGAVPLASLRAGGATVDAARCVAASGAPTNTAYVDSAVAADGTYLVGAGQFTDGSRGAVVIQVGVDDAGAPTSTTVLGEGTAIALERLTALDHATIGADGELIVHQGAAALARVQGRWRALAPTPTPVLDAVAVGSTLVAITATGVMTSRGHGYQVLHDFRQPSGIPLCDADLGQVCQVMTTGRDLTSEWILAAINPATTGRQLVRDGVRTFARVEGVATQARRLALGQGAAWVAARAVGQASAWLFHGVDDPRPELAVAGAVTTEVDRLAVGPVHAAALIRATFAAGEPEVALVATRTAAAGSGLILWRTTTIDDVAVIPVAGGDDAVVAVVTRSTASGSLETVLHRLDGTAQPPVLARLSGVRTIRAIWGLDLDHLWLAGDDGVLLRYQDGQLADHSAALGARSDLRALTGTGPDDVFVGGAAGALHHFDGEAWTAVAPWSRPVDLVDLRLEGDELRVAASDLALALRLDRGAPPAPVCAP